MHPFRKTPFSNYVPSTRKSSRRFQIFHPLCRAFSNISIFVKHQCRQKAQQLKQSCVFKFIRSSVNAVLRQKTFDLGNSRRMETDNPSVTRILLAWTALISTKTSTRHAWYDYQRENLHQHSKIKFVFPARSCNILDILNNFPLAKDTSNRQIKYSSRFVFRKRGTKLSVRKENF